MDCVRFSCLSCPRLRLLRLSDLLRPSKVNSAAISIGRMVRLHARRLVHPLLTTIRTSSAQWIVREDMITHSNMCVIRQTPEAGAASRARHRAKGQAPQGHGCVKSSRGRAGIAGRGVCPGADLYVVLGISTLAFVRGETNSRRIQTRGGRYVCATTCIFVPDRASVCTYIFLFLWPVDTYVIVREFATRCKS